MERWLPPVELSKQEQLITKRLKRVRALFGFLREKRHIIFDAEFQARLEGMYRDTGAGEEPHPPALLCMVLLLQGYVGASDAEAVELSVMDLRWQMVLNCLGATEPLFSQGALCDFRARMLAHDMDRALLERTVRLVRDGALSRGEGQSLSKAVRVAIDSRPLVGAGKVEDTINLLGHAARTIVRLASKILQCPTETICQRSGATLLLAPSIKAGLDIDWSDPKQKATAIELLESQVSRLQRWAEEHLKRSGIAPVQPYLDAIDTVREQDLEHVDGKIRIAQGVARDRRISIEDSEMRHGRKSKARRFDGYKEHIARDLDVPVILACAVTPANRPEEEGAAPIGADILRQDFTIAELHIDRAYVNSALVAETTEQGGAIFAKPWGQRPPAPDMFSKADFKIDLRKRTVTCPAGAEEDFEPGTTVHFDPEVCGPCPLRAHCTQAASGKGRTLSVANDEAAQRRYRSLQASPSGRQALRARVAVEHSLAHVAARKGHRARYIGVQKNLFDLRRAAAIQNLETLQRLERLAA